MILGFTGTRKGLSVGQRVRFIHLLKMEDMFNDLSEFHHGDCVGTDEQAAELVRKLRPSVKIVNHPPKIKLRRAYFKGDEIMPERDYLERDRIIAWNCDVLIGTPFTRQELQRSGTWYTVRQARAAGKDVWLIHRKGELVHESP